MSENSKNSCNILKKSKKGQYKIKEMIFMLLFITIFFVIVLLFYLAISGQNLKNEFYQNTKQGAILLVAKLADSPELSCGGKDSVCIDSDKLVVFKEHSVYKNFWNIDGLVIKQIYPNDLNASKECNSGTYPNCNTYTIKAPVNTSVPDESYVSLCRVDLKEGYNYKKCTIGKIIVYTAKLK